MSEAAAAALALYETKIGQEDGIGEWFEMTQERINQFADVTIDHQFIHIDPEAAAKSPFGGTIAHGFLTLSMLTHLSGSVHTDPALHKGVFMGVNYGFDKVRFVSPVPSGSRIRARATLKAAELKGGNAIQTTRTFTIEVEGGERPAVVADWIVRATYA
jgi:acyl dehydratase